MAKNKKITCLLLAALATATLSGALIASINLIKPSNINPEKDKLKEDINKAKELINN
ncbi:hypothetical protein [[Mycoplasma] falconis]|uniref:hypothetical protein n=1 Tax=[Mycoplasma] falconis TaxID=92403 RepID=UPI001476E43F|nr:hypothetical protein [[Mycoplasma] falconis]